MVKGKQTIGFGAAPSVVVGGTGTVTATGGASGNAVTFTSTTPSVCTVTGTTVTALTIGTCTIAADQAGNTSYNEALRVSESIVVGDDVPPVLTILSPSNGSFTNNPTLNVTGTATDNVGIQSITINNIVITNIQLNGSFTHAITLNPGSNTITAIARDTVGNETTATRTVTLDQGVPEITVTSPADNSATKEQSVTLSGTVSERSTIILKLNNGCLLYTSDAADE